MNSQQNNNNNKTYTNNNNFSSNNTNLNNNNLKDSTPNSNGNNFHTEIKPHIPVFYNPKIIENSITEDITQNTSEVSSNTNTTSTTTEPVNFGGFARKGFKPEANPVIINSTNNMSNNKDNFKNNKITQNNGYNNTSSNGNMKFNTSTYNTNSSYNQNKYINTGNNYQSNQQQSNWFNRYSHYDNHRNKRINEENSEFLKEHITQLELKDKSQNKMQQEIFVYNTELEKLSVTKTIKAFSEMSLNKSLSTNVKNMMFTSLTPIQESVTPLIMENKDIMGCAQTGSGKTVAFLLPVLNKMLENGPPKALMTPRVSYPVVLILVPTRELATQISKVSRLLSANTGISIVSLYGGVSHEEQVRDLRYGADIIISTTGRLLDFLQSKTVNLSFVETLIIDEADRLLEMGFEKQLNEIMNMHEMTEKTKRQTLLFSATFSKEIRITAKDLLKDDYLLVSCDIYDYEMNKNIDQTFYYIEENDKLNKLHEILQNSSGPAIIFLDRKKAVDDLLKSLSNANYNCIAIHGDKTQFDRNNAIDRFKSGKIPILLATDVVGRGIDFPNVSFIVNYDTPKNIDDYIHRIGRTGRCGNKGKSYSFINDNSRPIINDLYNLLTKQDIAVPNFIKKMYYDRGSYQGYGNNKRGGYNKGYNNRGYNNNNYGNEGDFNDFNEEEDYTGNSNNIESLVYNFNSKVSLVNNNSYYQCSAEQKMCWRK